MEEEGRGEEGRKEGRHKGKIKMERK